MRLVRDGIKLVAALLAVAVFAVIIDRSADAYAEARTAAAFGMAFETEVDMSIEGYPFLTQWRSGEYRDVKIKATRFDISGMTVKKVRLNLKDVEMAEYSTGPEDIQQAKARKARLSGTVPYDELRLPFGMKAKHKPGTDDQVRVTGRVPVTVLGKRLYAPFAADVRISLNEKQGKVRLQPRSVQVLGGLSSKLVDGLVKEHINTSFEAPKLAKGMSWEDVTAEDDGLRAVASGTDVELPKE